MRQDVGCRVKAGGPVKGREREERWVGWSSGAGLEHRTQAWLAVGPVNSVLQCRQERGKLRLTSNGTAEKRDGSCGAGEPDSRSPESLGRGWGRKKAHAPSAWKAGGTKGRIDALGSAHICPANPVLQGLNPGQKTEESAPPPPTHTSAPVSWTVKVFPKFISS